MGFARIFTAVATFADQASVETLLSQLPEELARECRAGSGKRGHYKFKGTNGYWVVYGDDGVALYRVAGITLADAEKISSQVQRLRKYSDKTFAKAVRLALGADIRWPH